MLRVSSAAIKSTSASVFCARADDTASALYVFLFVVKRFVYGIRKHQRRARRCVLFQIVVFFNDFHVAPVA